MSKLCDFTAALLLATGVAGAASSASLTFDGNICGGGNLCSNGMEIDQDYGDIPGQLGVIYDRDRSTTANENLFFWASGYETLSNIAYGQRNGGGLSILFQPLPGYKVTLTAFDIAPYLNRERDSLVQVVDIGTNDLLVNDVLAPVSTAGVTGYSGNWMSTMGIQINLGPDAWDIGIDNVDFSVAEVAAPIPLPAAAWLLGGALLGLGALRRRT